MSAAVPSSSLPRRLRVLQVITRLGLGGAEKVSLALVHGLRSEVDFAVFTVNGLGADAVGADMAARLAAANIPWFRGTRLTVKRGGMITGGLALARAIRRFRPDIVHFHAETAEICGAVMTCLPLGIPRPALVRTIHNSVFWRYWPRFGHWCDHRLAHAHIAGVSEAALAEFFRYRTDSGAPAAPSPPTVIYNGINLPLLPPRGAPDDPAVRRVLFAGRLEPQKGTDILAAALPQVVLPPGVRGELFILGHGAQAPLLTALAAQPPPGWRIEIRPPVAHLPRLLPTYDLVVMPSRFEGLGLVAVEATFCGTPIVATAAPGLNEALPVTHPWLARPGDAPHLAAVLTGALRETDCWAPVTAAAQRFAASRFASARMLDAYGLLYQAARRGVA